MESFFQQVTKIEEDLQKIERNCDAVDMAHQIIIHSVSEEEIKEQEAIIGSFMDLTNKASASVKGLLKSMSSETEALASQAPPGSGDLRMRRVKHAALVKKFSTLMKRFQEIQQRASSKHQAQIQRQYKISKKYFEVLTFLVNPTADQDELDNVANTVGAMTLTSQQIFSLGQSRNPLETLEKMKERRKDVMAIEKGIVVLIRFD
jgi:t-SNARE complex subunit (syntaxin)